MTAQEVIRYMESLHDEKQRRELMRFFKTAPGEYGYGDEFLGIKVPQTREIVKVAAKDTTLSEIPELLTCRWHEVRLCGLLILVWHFERLTAKRLVNDVEAIHKRDDILMLYLKYAERANNWDLVDLSAPKILGHWLMLPTMLPDGHAGLHKDYKLETLDELASSTHEHRLHVEDVAAGRRLVVSALCRGPSAPSSRPDAQGCWLDVARDGQAGVHGPFARLPQPACQSDAANNPPLCHRKDDERRTIVLDEYLTTNTT